MSKIGIETKAFAYYAKTCKLYLNTNKLIKINLPQFNFNFKLMNFGINASRS